MVIDMSVLLRCWHSKVFEFVIVLLCHFLGVRALAFRWRVVVVEITCISSMFDLWDDRAFDSSMIQGFPVNDLEKWVRLYKSSAVDTTARDVAEPLGWIDCAETANEVAGIR